MYNVSCALCLIFHQKLCDTGCVWPIEKKKVLINYTLHQSIYMPMSGWNVETFSSICELFYHKVAINAVGYISLCCLYTYTMRSDCIVPKEISLRKIQCPLLKHKHIPSEGHVDLLTLCTEPLEVSICASCCGDVWSPQVKALLSPAPSGVH